MGNTCRRGHESVKAKKKAFDLEWRNKEPFLKRNLSKAEAGKWEWAVGRGRGEHLGSERGEL